MPINWNRSQPAPLALWRLVSANFPQARNLGIFNRRNIAGTNTPSLHAEGRALDIGLRVTDPSEKLVADQLFQAFMDLGAQIGLQEVIWNRRIWSARRPVPHAHTGSNPHTDHIHVGFTRAASQSLEFPILAVRVAIIRTGLEELSAANRTYA
jgi:hypothetical protein